MEIRGRNINSVFARAIDRLYAYELHTKAGDPHCLSQKSRNGPVLEWEEPVLTIYERPQERVLFWPAREANPFFHFFESLWILRGRNDVAFLAQLVKRIREYSDNGVVLNGAYGHRARIHPGDQLGQCVSLLQEFPDTRRAVVGLWQPEDAWDAVDSLDIPCNTQLFFQLRHGVLNMTITNRSNDILWGAYGANAVHFSMIMEWVANKVGVPMGTMYQFSNSWHVYTEGPGGELYRKLMIHRPPVDPFVQGHSDKYTRRSVVPFPMGAENDKWDVDLLTFFQLDADFNNESVGLYHTAFFSQVVIPMREAWRTRDLRVAESIQASDWRVAAVQWLERRNGRV